MHCTPCGVCNVLHILPRVTPWIRISLCIRIRFCRGGSRIPCRMLRLPWGRGGGQHTILSKFPKKLHEVEKLFWMEDIPRSSKIWFGCINWFGSIAFCHSRQNMQYIIHTTRFQDPHCTTVDPGFPRWGNVSRVWMWNILLPHVLEAQGSTSLLFGKIFTEIGLRRGVVNI